MRDIPTGNKQSRSEFAGILERGHIVRRLSRLRLTDKSNRNEEVARPAAQVTACGGPGSTRVLSTHTTTKTKDRSRAADQQGKLPPRVRTDS